MQWWIEGRGLAPTPPYFQSKLRPKGLKKKNILDRPPHLSQGLVDRSQTLTPTPSSEGLDLPLLCAWSRATIGPNNIPNLSIPHLLTKYIYNLENLKSWWQICHLQSYFLWKRHLQQGDKGPEKLYFQNYIHQRMYSNEYYKRDLDLPSRKCIMWLKIILFAGHYFYIKISSFMPVHP